MGKSLTTIFIQSDKCIRPTALLLPSCELRKHSPSLPPLGTRVHTTPSVFAAVPWLVRIEDGGPT